MAEKKEKDKPILTLKIPKNATEKDLKIPDYVKFPRWCGICRKRYAETNHVTVTQLGGDKHEVALRFHIAVVNKKYPFNAHSYQCAPFCRICDKRVGERVRQCNSLFDQIHRIILPEVESK